jgi:predicted alpha/beta hydrolase
MPTDIDIRDVTIPADDGYRLAATVFVPANCDPAAPVTIIAAATGVPARFYRRFAHYLAAHGRIALTFDYRGIGSSLDGHARRSTARFRDWGILDAPGVLAYATATFPGRPIHWVGQSYGGFAPGLAHNNQLIDRLFAMSSMSADVRFVSNRIERMRISALLFGIGPVIAHTLGYVPGWVNGGTDLPKGVLLEWSRWCRTRDFLFGLDDLPERRHFANFRGLARFAYMDDDAWVDEQGVMHLARQFTAADRSIVRITREQIGGRPVGHIGFFRSEFRDALWPLALDWLDGR